MIGGAFYLIVGVYQLTAISCPSLLPYILGSSRVHPGCILGSGTRDTPNLHQLLTYDLPKISYK